MLINNIQTKRTILRAFTNDDLGDIFEVLGNDLVMQFSLNGTMNKDDCKNFIERVNTHYEKHGYGLMAVELKENKKVIGYCGLISQVIDGQDEVEVGYRLHLDYWNQGIATETALASMQYGFSTLKLNKIISIIEAENTASIRVAEKNGLTLEKETLYKEKIPVRIYCIRS